MPRTNRGLRSVRAAATTVSSATSTSYWVDSVRSSGPSSARPNATSLVT